MEHKININNNKYSTAIIILNWNGLADTIACLQSIQNYCADENALVVLVDNNSSQSIDPLIEIDWHIPILIIKNPENSGFAAGNNIGIVEALHYGVTYILLLNNDTVLLDNLVQIMVGALDSLPDVGVVGAVNYYFSNPDTIWQAGATVSTKSGKVKQVDINTIDSDIIDMDYVPGSSLMFRANLIPVIGALDENFFAYSEELEFCFRVKQTNYRIICLKKAKILHKVGKSSSNAAKEYLRLRNKFYLFKKYSTGSAFLMIALRATVRAIILATIAFLKNKKKPYYSAIYYAIIDYKNGNMGKGNFERFL